MAAGKAGAAQQRQQEREAAAQKRAAAKARAEKRAAVAAEQKADRGMKFPLMNLGLAESRCIYCSYLALLSLSCCYAAMSIVMQMIYSLELRAKIAFMCPDHVHVFQQSWHCMGDLSAFLVFSQALWGPVKSLPADHQRIDHLQCIDSMWAVFVGLKLVKQFSFMQKHNKLPRGRRQQASAQSAWGSNRNRTRRTICCRLKF